MAVMKKNYVEKRDGGYWIAGTRISLDSVVYAFNRGALPEGIKKSFPLLTLEEIYGALAFYLGNQEKIDKYLADSETEFQKEAAINHAEFKKSKPELYERLQKRKREVVSR